MNRVQKKPKIGDSTVMENKKLVIAMPIEISFVVSAVAVWGTVSFSPEAACDTFIWLALVQRANVGKQCDCACAFYRMGQFTLVLCACSWYASRDNFTPLANKISECLFIFVVYNQIGIGTKTTDFSAMINSFFPVGTFWFPRFVWSSHIIAPLFCCRRWGLGHFQIRLRIWLPLQWFFSRVVRIRFRRLGLPGRPHFQ